MAQIEPTDSMQWIKPLASFTTKVINGYQIEIPAAVAKPLDIKYDDVVEVAYVGLNESDTVTVFHTVVGVRNRIGIKKDIAIESRIGTGDIILMGILSVFHSRSDGLVVVFDPDALPEWYDGERHQEDK